MIKKIKNTWLKAALFAAVLGAGALTACSDDDSSDGAKVVIDPTVSYQIVSVDTLTSEEMAEKIYNDMLERLRADADDDGGNSEEDFEAQALETKNAYLKRTQEICDSLEQATGANGMVMCHKTCTYYYTSIDAYGNPITLSAFVSAPQCWFFGRRNLTPNNVLLYCHECDPRDSKCPSNNGGPSGSSHPDAIVIAPDFIGYGATKGIGHPMNYDLSARNALDALKVGYKIAIDDWGFELDKDWHTYIIGWHEGSAIALATQKLMEQDEAYCNKMKLKLSFVFHGAFDLAYNVDSIINSGTVADNNVSYLPRVIVGLMAGYPEAKHFSYPEAFFTDAFLNTDALNLIWKKESDEEDINDAILKADIYMKSGYFSKKVDLKKMLNPDLFDENSELYKELHQCLEKNIVYKDWKPTHYIHFYYTDGHKIESIRNIDRFAAHLDSQGLKYNTDYYIEHGSDSGFYWSLQSGWY